MTAHALRRPRRRTAGKFSVASAVVLVLIVVGLYFGFMYLPVLVDKWNMGGLAEAAATKMMVEFDDMAIRRKIMEDAKAQGVVVGLSDIYLQRGADGSKHTVTIRWTEQVKHLWGTNHVIKMEVVETAQRSSIKMKNAE